MLPSRRRAFRFDTSLTSSMQDLEANHARRPNLKAQANFVFLETGNFQAEMLSCYTLLTLLATALSYVK